MKKVLLVDDNDILREVMAHHLNQSFKELEIREGDSLESAKYLYKNFKPNYLVTDYRLPDGLSLDFIKIIIKQNENLKIVVVTGFVNQSLQDFITKHKNISILTKPFEMSALIEKLGKTQSNSKLMKLKDEINNHLQENGEMLAEESQNRHYLLNKMSVLLTGIRLVGMMIDDEINDENNKKSEIDKRIEQMVSLIKEISLIISNSKISKKGQAF